MGHVRQVREVNWAVIERALIARILDTQFQNMKFHVGKGPGAFITSTETGSAL